MRPRLALSVALATSALAAPTLAQTQNALALAQLASSCANCHGTAGRTAEGSPLPALAGAPRAQTLESLKAFKAGTRPSTIMTQLAKGYSDAQLEQLADWFAGQKK